MRKTLLLADDSITIQRVIALTFADEPIDVVAVGDGTAAIERLDAGPPDIVLADIGMPGQDGYAVAMHVRKTAALAHIPVILLTGAFDPVDYGRVREAGCAGVLVKPFDPQMIVARVRSLLGASPSGDRADVAPEANETTIAAAPAAAAAAVSETAPAAAPEARAAIVDKYFEQLDRAFAELGAREQDARTFAAAAPVRAAVPGAAEHAPGGTPSVRQAQAEVTPDVSDDAADSAPASRQADADVTRDVVDAAVADWAPAFGRSRPDVVAEAGHAPTAAQGAPPGRAEAVAPPTLGDAFGALLALEQGQPLPGHAPDWASWLSAGVVEQIAARVGREVSERVVRELAPQIVSELAERLVREEIEQLKTLSPPR